MNLLRISPGSTEARLLGWDQIRRPECPQCCLDFFFWSGHWALSQWQNLWELFNSYSLREKEINCHSLCSLTRGREQPFVMAVRSDRRSLWKHFPDIVIFQQLPHVVFEPFACGHVSDSVADYSPSVDVCQKWLLCRRSHLFGVGRFLWKGWPRNAPVF